MRSIQITWREKQFLGVYLKTLLIKNEDLDSLKLTFSHKKEVHNFINSLKGHLRSYSKYFRWNYLIFPTIIVCILIVILQIKY